MIDSKNIQYTTILINSGLNLLIFYYTSGYKTFVTILVMLWTIKRSDNKSTFVSFCDFVPPFTHFVYRAIRVPHWAFNT